jgi:hypothetical protein
VGGLVVFVGVSGRVSCRGERRYPSHRGATKTVFLLLLVKSTVAGGEESSSAAGDRLDVSTKFCRRGEDFQLHFCGIT